MEFANERTWLAAAEFGKQEEFHSRYETEVYKVREQFGDKHPNHVGDDVLWSNAMFEDRSPNDTRIVLGRFPKGSRQVARRAIEAARAAFAEWSHKDYRGRARIILQAADIMSQRKYELAALMSFENGKNRFEALADVDEAIDMLRYYSQVLIDHEGFDREMGRAVPNERSRSALRPYGVWAVISPFNFPLAIAAGMTVGALITGNTAVLKPASDTPFLALRLYEILREAGLPPGVLNYVTGPGGTVGASLVGSDDVAGLVFTGSRDVGVRSLRTFTAKRPKPIVTEMGGKNPIVVTANANLDAAIEGTVKGAFGYGGQKCSAASRLLVDRKVRRSFLERLVEETEELAIGDPTERDVYLGPLINEAALAKFRKSAKLASRDGRVLAGGRARTGGVLAHGYYAEPTIADGLPRDHRINREELFVPILSVIPVDGLDDAITVANSVAYGLTAGIFSEDEEEVRTFFDRVDAGVVYANRRQGATTGAMVGAQPFVGWKMSGISGKGAGGPYYLQQFLREQSQTRYV